MITDRFDYRPYRSGYYDNIYEAFPRGKENAIFPWELSSTLQYFYGISLYEEALRVIRNMQADGYLIIEDNGRFYRAKSLEELASVYGRTFASYVYHNWFWIL